MKKVLFVLSIVSLFAFSCSNGDAEAKAQAEVLKAEIMELDSLSTDLDATIEGIEQSKAAVEEALNALD